MLARCSKLAVAAALIATAAGCERERPQANASLPNVILISLDTLRARNMSAYGYPRSTSPFFDELAVQGVLFETAVTTSVTTGPSHMSLFTGVYPRSHGLLTGLEYDAVPESMPRLATILEAAGYHTKAITENGFIIRRAGFEEGFDEYSEHLGERRRSAPGLVEQSFGEAREWLRAEREEPFFLFLHTYEVHSPYDPPRRYASLFGGDGAGDRLVENLYDREIAYLDEHLAHLFEVIAGEERVERRRGTLVVIVSDHGEEFFEHGAFQHGAQVFEETIRVPLLFWGDGIPAGRRIGGQVSIIDVVPTLLDLLGVPIPDTVEGESLAPVIREGAAPPSRPLFAEATAPRRLLLPGVREPVEPIRLAVRFDDRKYVVHRPSQGEPEPMVRFDLESDPMEENPKPVGGSEAAAIDQLVDRYMSAGGAALASEEEFARQADPALVERLRSLGYIE